MLPTITDQAAQIIFLQNQVKNYYRRLLNTSSSWRGLEDVFLELETFLAQVDPSLVEFVLGEPEIQKNQPAVCRLRAAYEYQREKYWAALISQHPDPATALKTYPNYDRHAATVEYEYNQIKSRLPQIRKILFIGGGPLPLTPIFLFRNGKIPITILEKEDEACKVSMDLLKCLQIEHNFQILNQDVPKCTHFGGYDIVWVAMLVGEGITEKLSILQHLLARLIKGQKLVVRAAAGFQKLFYTGLEDRAISTLRIRWEMAGSSIMIEKSSI